MEHKSFFFLAGLQRSGATLLSSILNQNPDMWVSPASPLFRLMVAETTIYDSTENIDYDRKDGIAQAIARAPHAFYSDKEVKHVIDKNLNWQTPNGIGLIKTYITDRPKIICPVRSIPEILASFDSIITGVKGNETNSIDAAVQRETMPIGNSADRRAEWLMRYDKDITICLNGMKLALNPDLRDMFLFVEYSDLVSDPEAQVERIYEFLEIPEFEHEYQNIVDPTDIPEDSPVTGIRHLHKVRPKIEKKSVNPEKVLSKETINRYSGLEFWRSI
jgi:sulfotransferase